LHGIAAEVRGRRSYCSAWRCAFQNDVAVQRFGREARALSALNHPYLCSVFEAGEENGEPYLVLRYVEGETLARRLAQARAEASAVGRAPATLPLPTRVEVEAAVALIAKIADALHHAHERGFVHRDVKPGNIMVQPDGEPVLLDFGVVYSLGTNDATLTETEQKPGTPAYMAPEQARGDQHPDRRADVYALGAVLFEMLTYQRPFEAATLHELFQKVSGPARAERVAKINPLVTRDLATVIETALAKEVAHRYATARDLGDDLRRVLRSEPIRARRPSHLVRAEQWVRRNKAATGLISALATLALVSSWLLIVQRDTWAREQRADSDLRAAMTHVREAWRRGEFDDAASRTLVISAAGASGGTAAEWCCVARPVT
jgi:serine/threonine-protein kinase